MKKLINILMLLLLLSSSNITLGSGLRSNPPPEPLVNTFNPTLPPEPRANEEDFDPTTPPEPQSGEEDEFDPTLPPEPQAGEEDDFDPTLPPEPQTGEEDDFDPTLPPEPQAGEEDEFDPTLPPEPQAGEEDDFDPTLPPEPQTGDDDDFDPTLPPEPQTKDEDEFDPKPPVEPQGKYVVTLSADPAEGCAGLIGAGKYDYNMTISVGQTTADGYTFLYWSLDDEQYTNQESFSYNVTKNAAFVAHYRLDSEPPCQPVTEQVAITICQGEQYNGHTESGTYTDIFRTVEGCDSIVVATIIVLPTYNDQVNVTLCQGEQYNGHTASGTYTDTFQTQDGCDSVVVSTITVLPVYHEQVSVTLCPGEQYNGHTTAGTYTDTFKSIDGCDSVVVSTITVLPVYTEQVNVTLCQSESYNSHSESGTYTDMFNTIEGCDSVVVSTITVLPAYNEQVTITLCQGKSYNGHSESGTYTDMFKTVEDCDSVVVSTITVLPTYTLTVLSENAEQGSVVVIQEPTCENGNTAIVEAQPAVGYKFVRWSDGYTSADNAPILRRTITLTENLNLIAYFEFEQVCQPVTEQVSVTLCQGESYNGHTESGTYTDTFQTIDGCDSVVVSTITVLPAYYEQVNITLCQGEQYNGHTTSGTYTDMFQTVEGCDSVVVSTITVLPTYHEQVTITLCQGEHYNGHTTSGTYADTFKSIDGCDSVVVSTIIVLPTYNEQVNITLCQGEQYNGHTTSGMYTDTFQTQDGCDSVVVSTITVLPVYNEQVNVTLCKGEQYNGHSESGTYTDTFQSVDGCDSVVVAAITVLPAYYEQVNITLCQGEQYNGHTASGTYTDMFQTVEGCDSVVVATITVLPTYTLNVQSDNAEQGSVVVLQEPTCENGNTAIFETHPATGYKFVRWSDDYMSDDNTLALRRTLTLTENFTLIAYFEAEQVCQPITEQVSITLCQGEQYNGHAEGGTYTDMFKTVDGCDSVVVSTITVLPTYKLTVQSENAEQGSVVVLQEPTCENSNVAIVEAQPAMGYKFVRWSDGYTSDDNTPAFRRTITLTENLNLIAYFEVEQVCQPVNEQINITLCQGEQYNGHSESGTYIDTFKTIDGCDSVVVSTITVLSTYHEQVSITLCQGESYNGHSTSGTYTDTFQSIDGCDSVVVSTITMLPIYKLTVQSDNAEQGSVIVIQEPTCENGNTAIVEAQPASGYTFISWSDGSQNNPRFITLTRDMSLSATFTEEEQPTTTYIVTVDVYNGVGGEVFGGGEYEENTIVEISAAPFTHYSFRAWSDGDFTNPRQVRVVSNVTYSAIFVLNRYTITVTCDPTMGRVIGSGTYKYGTEVTLEAAPFREYEFVSWSDGDNSNPRHLFVEKDTEIEALFHNIETDIEQSETSITLTAPRKIVENGHVYILLPDGRKYNVTGAEVR